MDTASHDFARVALATLAICKVILLFAFAPLNLPDSGGYAQYADSILANRNWLTHIDLQSEPFPILAFRMAGYPLLMATAKLLFGPFSWYGLVLVQIAFSLYVTYRFWRCLGHIGLGSSWALAGAACQATGLIFWLDQCLLTDSIYVSLVTLATVLLVESCLDHKVSVSRFLGIGVILALAFLLREASAVLFLLLVPAVYSAARGVGANATYSAVLTAALLIPLLATNFGYRAWNELRTGR